VSHQRKVRHKIESKNPPHVIWGHFITLW